ncbi:MAG: hypothetical protein IPN82_14870 [Chitinophagaceae bacterium]|nr:hypothetical protein [Chitinophagaceae bacterium]
MRYIKKQHLLLIIVIAVNLFSCVPQREVTTHKQDLAKVDSQLLNHSKKLKELDKVRQQKQDENEISDTASYKIQKFIGMTNDEIDKIVGQNEILIGDVSVNKSDWLRLQKALTFSSRTEKLINDKVSLITELINRNTVVKLEQDVIFGPGQYNLSPAVAFTIGKMFEPVTKEIDYFINKYPDFPMSLVITAKGYADATTISEGSNLYKKIVERMRLSGKKPLTNEDLNNELSTARAESVIKLLQTFTVGKSADGKTIKNILYLFEGKGEKFPDNKINDYGINDPRRRMVLLFWSIFPD